MTEPIKTRVLIYLRVSSHGQRDNQSLPTQREACLAFAEREGWTVVGAVEEVYTGTELERPQLARLTVGAKNGEFDVMLVFDEDRFSRDPLHLSVLLYGLKEAGVEVWSVRQGQFKLGGVEYAMHSLRAVFAQHENAQRRERSMRGHRGKVGSGKLLGSSPKATYGYRFSDDRCAYLVDEDEVVIVRRIFEAVLAGTALRAIAVELNRDGIPSPYAGHAAYGVSGLWRHQTLKRLVDNEFYKGEAWALINRRLPKEKGKRYGKVVIDHDNGVRLPDGTVPALVSGVDWNRAQEIVAGRRLHRREVGSPEEVLLRGGIARCGNCGRAMRLAKRPSGHRYYQCNKMSAEAGACSKPSPSIKTQFVEEPVWGMIRSILLEPTKIWDRFHSQQQQDREAAMLAELQTRHGQIEQRRRTLLRNLELLDDADVVELRPRLDALAVELGTLDRQVTALRQRIVSRDGERDRITRLLEWARTEVERVDEMTVEQKRAVLLELGVVVRVFPSTAPERYTVELGTKLKPTAEEFFADLDWSNVTKPTSTQRRETARLTHEATERGHESDLVGRLVEGQDSADSQHTWDYWDDHVREDRPCLHRHQGMRSPSPSPTRNAAGMVTKRRWSSPRPIRTKRSHQTRSSSML